MHLKPLLAYLVALCGSNDVNSEWNVIIELVEWVVEVFCVDFI